MRGTLTTAIFVVAASVATASLTAQPGTLLRQIDNPAGKGRGVGIAIDCDGNLYYTRSGLTETTLEVLDANGNGLRSLPLMDGNGRAIPIDEIAYDRTRNVLWGIEHGSFPTRVHQIDLTTGRTTLQWNAQTGLFDFKDGIAYDATDDTVWVSEDAASTVQQYRVDGTLIKTLIPKNAVGGTLGSISGITTGLGDLLYLGQNGRVQIVQVKKSNGDFVAAFASPAGNRDEGLECDPINFSPKLALWSRDVDGALTAVELEADSCGCGGGGICTQPASFELFGNGCAGTLGTPTLLPRDGQNPILCREKYVLHISNSLGQTTHACVLVSALRTNTPILGCDLLVDLSHVSAQVFGVETMPPAGKTFGFRMDGILCNSLFCGATIHMQVIELDPGAPQSVSFSRGLTLTLGG